MVKTYSDLMSEIKQTVKTVSLDEMKRRLEQKVPMVLVDVREKDEFRGGYIPGAISLPRGFLEMQAEQKLPDKSAPIVTYCAGGTRSAFAAKTLADLGYTHVESANPGFVRWKDLKYPVEQPPNLTDAQRDRYSRHILLPEVGEAGQAKLLGAKVLLLGADVVDASNLQRQIVHATSRLGTPKVESAAKSLRDLNPDVKVETYEERLTSANVDRIFSPYDVIVDGCDNFPTRFLVNDASVFLNKPVVHGSIFRFDGQVTTFVPGSGPCYRCWYPEPPPPHLAPSCQEAGVLGILCGIIGTLQATEAIKLILGKGDSLVGRILTYDSLKMKFREFKLRKDPNCPVCGKSPTIKSYIDYE